jgi:hypothetical protein
MEMNILIPGKWWIESESIDEKTGDTKYKFGFTEQTKELGKEFINRMEEAESELLLPLLKGEKKFPSMADMSLAPYWKH